MAREVPVKTPRFVILAALCIVVAALYFARDVLIPLALAVMISFLLGPVVTRLERMRLPRAAAVSIVVTILFTVLAALTWIVILQVEDLAGQLPKYQDNIAMKLRGIRGHGDSKIEKAAEAITRAAEAATTAPTSQAAAVEPHAGPAGSAESNPVYAKIVSGSGSTYDVLSGYAGTVLGPIGTFGVVIVFVIFMLLQREDLRDRILRLVGEGQLHVTTQAVDDATRRITKYLVAQAIVNGTYGIAISIGLFLIGYFIGGTWFPSFVLWGLLCAVLRFIPYIGPWIGAIFPIGIAFAVFPGYGVFVGVLALFGIIELLSNNLMEPWLYGSSTGISTVAILVAAVFWTWLWGPVGLLLATPLTVCIVVMGKYVPQLAFLDILLGDEPVLEPHQRLYQRLLAGDAEEASDIAEEYFQKHSLEEVYDQMVLPALAIGEQDRHSGRVDETRGMAMRQTLRELVDQLADLERANLARTAAGDTERAAKGETDYGAKAIEGDVRRPQVPKDCVINIVALPSHDEADEIVGIMLAELLQLRGYCAFAVSQNALASEMLEQVAKKQGHIVCLSALPPSAITHTRYLSKRLIARFSDLPMVLGLWTLKMDSKKIRRRLLAAEDSPIATDLAQALEHISRIAQPMMISDKPPHKITIPEVVPTGNNGA